VTFYNFLDDFFNFFLVNQSFKFYLFIYLFIYLFFFLAGTARLQLFPFDFAYYATPINIKKYSRHGRVNLFNF